MAKKKAKNKVIKDNPEVKPGPRCNIKLKEGATPATIEGFISVGNNPYRAYLPSLEIQAKGWYSPKAKLIAACYGSRYELTNGGCCKDA